MSVIEVGSAVVPTKGKYAGRPMVALGVLDGYAYLCDGKKRGLDRPKRKKLCHLSLISPDAPRLTVDAGLTNGGIRRFLKAFRACARFPDDMNTIQQ